jgi:excisionase family DNA binding protein
VAVFDPGMAEIPVLVTTDRVAEMLNVTPQTVRLWTREGKLHPVPWPGRTYRYRLEDIEAILAGTPAA